MRSGTTAEQDPPRARRKDLSVCFHGTVEGAGANTRGATYKGRRTLHRFRMIRWFMKSRSFSNDLGKFLADLIRDLP